MKYSKKLLSGLLCMVLVLQLLITSEPVKNAFAAETAAGSQVSDFKILGSIGGPTNAVAAEGNYVYVGKGTTILTLKSDNGSLMLVGEQVNLPSYVSDLKIQGKYLYAAVGSAGMYIIDISNPLKPEIEGIYTSAGFTESIAVDESYAYLADGYEGLQIIDVSNPAKPVMQGQLRNGMYAFKISVSGGRAYLAAGDDGLLIVDVAQISTPKELAVYNTPGIARDVAVEGQYAYVADDWKGVSVVNISNPAEPKITKEIHTAGRAHGLTVKGEYLYVADAYMGLRVFNISSLSKPVDLTSFIPDESQLMRVVVCNHLLYCADRANGILCFDTSKPSELKLKGFYSHTVPIPLTYPDEMEHIDGRKYIGRLITLGVLDEDMKQNGEITRAEFAELLCRTVKKTDMPSKNVIRFEDVPTKHWAYRYIENAVIAGLMESKDKTHFDPDGKIPYGEAARYLLGLINSIPKKDKSPENCIKEIGKLGIDSIYIQGERSWNMYRYDAYIMFSRLICEIADKKTGLMLLQSKFGIWQQAFPMQAVETAVIGNYAYVTTGKYGLSVVDIKNPSNPKQVAHLDFPETALFIRVNGKYAYVLSTAEIYVIDISDPLHPVVTYSFYTPGGGPARGVTIDSNRMYVADEWGDKVYSIEDPAKPVLIKAHTGLGSDGQSNVTSDIAVRDGIAYYPTSNEGVRIYDVSDLEHYRYLGTYASKEGDRLPFYANVQFFGNLAFVKGQSVNSIEILDISDIRKPVHLKTIQNVENSQFNYAMGIYKNLAILPNDRKGVLILDISNPSSAEEVACVDTTGIPVNVVIDQKRAYVADSFGGLNIISLTKEEVTAPADSGSEPVQPKIAPKDFNISAFEGLPAEAYVLNAEKTLAVMNNAKTSYTQTLTVTNTNDSGKGSLRWCMETIKAGGRILFDTKVFPASKPAVIYCKSTLEFKTDHILLDASRAGVILDGSKTPEGTRGIRVNTDGNWIRGLKMQNFTSFCIEVNSKENIIGGSRKKGSGPNGEGNVIIKSYGMWIYGLRSTGNIIVGNNVGIDSDGVTPAGNIGGIDLRGASFNVVGIDREEYRNLVSDNRETAISVMGVCGGNLIEGNYVGTDITGLKDIGNKNAVGITFELGAYGSIARKNVSCGNEKSAFQIWDSGGNFIVFVDNRMGIGADGQTEIPSKNYIDPLGIGGGVGGGCCYNVIGGKDKETANTVFPREGMGGAIGVYDTLYNGIVYKYGYNDRY